MTVGNERARCMLFPYSWWEIRFQKVLGLIRCHLVLLTIEETMAFIINTMLLHKPGSFLGNFLRPQIAVLGNDNHSGSFLPKHVLFIRLLVPCLCNNMSSICF